MTPRPEMEAVDLDCTKEELAKIFKDTGFSRVPVYEEDIDKNHRRDKSKWFS